MGVKENHTIAAARTTNTAANTRERGRARGMALDERGRG